MTEHLINRDTLRSWIVSEFPSLAEDGTEEPTEPEEPEPDNRYEFTGEGFTITSTDKTPPMTYRFTVSGGVPGGESIEDADSITENDDGTVSVEGTVGPRGGDTYYLNGKLSGWETDNHNQDGATVPETDFDVLVAGEQRELWRLLDWDEPAYDDTSYEAIGGGEYYSQVVTEDDADVVATTHDELRTALSEASSGDVVFVDGSAEIYSPSESERYIVPDGVTLASDRGVGGSSGALLHTDAAYSYGAQGLVSVQGDNARVTGLRVRGPHPDVRWREHSYDYEMSAINARKNNAAGLEVDNCELWGFAHLVAADKDAHVHHNHLHRANMKGLGYCLSTGSTEGTVFEYNRCEHWRHVVAGSGGGGYEARFNLILGPAIGHAFDQHSPGGSYTELHHNTMKVPSGEVENGNDEVPFATFRGSNVQKARVYNNWSTNNSPPRDSPSESFTSEFITHPKHGGTGWTDIEWSNNHLGSNAPSDDNIGAPRGDTGNR